MKRRTFIRSASLAATALPLVTNDLLGRKPVAPEGLFIGTPVLPDYLFKKGIGNTLDRMQELAGIKTVMTFSHTHVFRQYQSGFGPRKDASGDPLTDLYVHTHARYYDNPVQAGGDHMKYAGRDVLDELYQETARRGMKIYARILEPYRITGVIPGFDQYAETDVNGNEGPNVCFNHPDYIRYWESVVEDLIRSHPYLDGFKYGQERGGPMFTALGGNPATCFCKYCTKIAGERQINVEVARKGLTVLQQFGEDIRAGKIPADGNFVTFLRILGNYPDLLSWEKLWMDSREEQRRRFFHQIRSLNDRIRVGWHIDHGMTWDLVTRAFDDYRTMGPYSDWLSVAVYFDSMGRRSLNHYDKYYRNLLFGDATENISFPMYLSMLGYNPEKEPSLSTLEAHDTAFSPEYVYRECSRAVKDIAGTTKVYARPGFDMPGYDCNVTPEQVYRAVTRALDAGVDGLWCGREWNELKPENAAAFGKAVRNYGR